MFDRRKRGFSFGVNTRNGNKKLRVWFSTDEKDRVDCQIADGCENVLVRKVAVRHDTDEFNLLDGMDVAFDKALSSLYERTRAEIEKDYFERLRNLHDMHKGLSRQMRKHLVKEEKFETKKKDRHDVNKGSAEA